MKIVVDFDRCESNGVCVRFAPEVFLVDDQDRLQVLLERPGEELREKLLLAIDRCPKMALSLVED